MKRQEVPSIYLPTRKQWREWLQDNHDSETIIWLVYYKKHTGKPSIPYNDAVEEALCFGWIDSTIRRIDEERYMQQFTPRKMKSTWSVPNVLRVEKLIKQGRMMARGLDLYNYANDHNLLPAPAKKKETAVPDIPIWFEEALDENPDAKKHFDRLAPSHKRNYLMWILDAKREETRLRRVREALYLLSRGEKLGMK